MCTCTASELTFHVAFERICSAGGDNVAQPGRQQGLLELAAGVVGAGSRGCRSWQQGLLELARAHAAMHANPCLTARDVANLILPPTSFGRGPCASTFGRDPCASTFGRDPSARQSTRSPHLQHHVVRARGLQSNALAKRLLRDRQHVDRADNVSPAQRRRQRIFHL
eukprot:352179-Chlamydomonas_euryale.AAC.5